ncbi:6,7-dimethyl-8-ribityllumazine synthase [Bacteroidia bacterium]|jgi:6,7-dimethyl-8-ribityllumazine synthase|nr:6,7-dimethyl-8-ribityllumazine synthase [Bacteroidia bacterium]MDC0105043.1 6,7-dimethyl-8-ribityllumazine synthase [Bacteroidia bacterium]|tara:strand:+ start:1645 stop:2112 length:468 start_codon:yes stop_codon:yes gene_type:complete
MADYSSQTFLNEEIRLPHTNFKIGVVTALWNSEITSKLKAGALDTLQKAGITNITVWDVPGSYELIYGANKLASEGVDAVICLGVVIQGETRHFDFICDAVANGIANVTIQHNIPVAFGLLTTENQQQAVERSGGKHGHKGEEAAWTVLKLLERA